MNPNQTIDCAAGLVPFRDADLHVAQLLEATLESSAHGHVAYVNHSPAGGIWIRAATGLKLVDPSDLQVRAPLRLAASAAAVITAWRTAPPVSPQAITDAQRAAIAELQRMRAAGPSAAHGASPGAARVATAALVAPPRKPGPVPAKQVGKDVARPRPVPHGFNTRAEHTAALRAAQAHAITIRQKQAAAAAVGYPLGVSQASALVHADRARR